MRKVLSIVLVLALVLGSTAFTFGAVPSDVSGTKYEDAVNVLMELDVISGYPDGSYKPAGIVTRGEMAKIIICALGLEEYVGGTSGFSDMAGHWSDKYVAYAASLGIINGYPDGTFKPDNTVSYDEAAKMLVAALGYTEDALIGSWPANWVVKARALGILDGVKAGPAGANRGDIALMAFNNLGNNLGYVNKDGEWVDNAPPETMLDRLGAEMYDPGTGVAGDPFVVDETHAEAAVANIREYIGAYVTAYANSDEEIIAIKEVKSVFLSGEVTDDDTVDMTEFKADGVKYAVNQLGYGAGPAPPEEFINGETNTGAGISTLTGADLKIAVDVSGKKIKEVYSIAVWTVNDDFQFADGDLDDESIGSSDFTLDDNDEIDINSFALLGVDSLADIKEDHVVYVYHAGGAGGDVARIEVGTEVVTGKVTKITSANDEITVGGKVYEFSQEANAVNSAIGMELGEEYELYLDYAGNVYEYEGIDVTKADNYAVILKVENAGTGAITAAKAKVELFLADGNAKVFDVKGADVALLSAAGVWTGAAVAGVTVEYGVNKDGLISSMSLILPIVSATEELTEKGYFHDYRVASSAVIFTTESGAASDDADDWNVTTFDKAKGSTYTAEYYYDTDSNKIEVMILKGAGSGDDDVYAIISGGWAQDMDSSTDYIVELYVDGATKAEPRPVVEGVYVNKTDDGLATGTALANNVLYKLKLNANGEIEGFLPHGLTAASVTIKTGTSYSNNTIINNADDKHYSLESSATVYIMVAGEVDKAEKASKNNLASGNAVTLYKTDAEGGYNIIIK